MAASLASSLAIDPERVVDSPRSLAMAAPWSTARAASMRQAMSASLNWIAWNSRMAFPNWRRSAA